MANVDEEVDSSSSSSSSSATTTPVVIAAATSESGAGFRHQDSGPRTVCGIGSVGHQQQQQHQHLHHGDKVGGLALVRMLKEELKERECASLPPMVYDGKSDLCTLGSRPGMECVPLRSPADPYHYHHVTDQTKSLQELQNEVGALLEFRDLVIETFPDLKTKMASASAANSTLTGIPSSSLASSRREWEPGIRTRRKLTAKDSHLSHQQQPLALVHPHHSQVTSSSSTVTSSGGVIVTSSEIHPHQHHHHHHHHHQQQQQQQHHSSSLISRSRSNSQSGGSSGGGGGGGSGHRKEPKSGDAQQSSSGGSVVIQDSGFSTETSSSKETHSASSSTGGGGQGGPGTVNVSSTTGSSSGVPNQRLGVDAEDELWNLLDVIHRKSNRLREEVDALQQLEREKCRTNVLNNNQNVQQTSASSSSSNSSNNNHHHIHSSSSSSSGGNLAKTFQNQLLATVATADTVAVNKDDVQILRKERDRLFEQLSDYEAEAMVARIRASKMQDEVDVLAAAKRDLESQLQAALSQKLELNGRIHDLHQQFVNKSAPSSPDSIKSRHHLQHLPLSTTSGSALRKHSSTDSTTTTLHLSATTSPSSASSNSQQHLLKPAALTRFSSGTGPGNSSHFAPIVKSVPTTTTGKTAIATPEDVATSPDGGGSSGALGKLDGLLSSPARVNKVRMTDSKKIAAILLETNIVELQRHLLTITVQNQVLQQRLEYATRSRIFMSKKLDKSKEDIDDLKFRLEEKNIELEGTKAQLRVLESKQQQLQSGKSSVTSSGFSPEHHANPSSTPATSATTITTATPVVKPSSTVVSTSAGGIVTSHLGSPVHQPYHQAPLRLQQGVSTPSMKAMIPLAMDEMLQNSSSTESAQDQAERYHHQQVTPETPKRKPSKIPLPGTKGYVAPKPPTGRNFVANKSTEKSSPSPSGSLSNKSLNKSTGSLYMRSSTGPSSITSRAPRDASINRPESAQSWSRRDTSLEKSRSSSIPVSSKAGGSPVVTKPSPTTVVSSSPQPKAKRDSLTTRVKNLDSLSRLQTAASASTGNLSKSSSKKDLSSTSFTTGQLGRPDRKSTSGGIRRVSSASIGRTSSTENTGGGANSSSSVASPAADADNGKARRTNTFRLAKPTLMPPLEIPSSPSTGAPPRGGIPRRSHLPIVVPPPRNKMAAASSTLIIMASSPDATARHHDSVAASTSSSGTCSSSSSDGGSSPSSVTTVTTIESHSSSTQVPPVSRDLIGEYLAAKSRSQGPPAILIPQVAPAPAREDAKDLELAYKHPILLMNDEDEQNVFCSVVSSVGNERNREVEVRYVDDNSIELLDAREDYGEGEKESLIVPKPKKMAFHSLKGSPVKNGVDEESKCRLVGKVNPNILKTWEQLSGGDKAEPTTGRRKNSKNSLITVTSSENSSADSKQSCLIFYRNQYNNMAAGEPEEEFHVNRIQHGSVSTAASSTVEDKAVPAMVTSTTSTTTTNSSEGCYDFYDSIDDSSTRIDNDAGVVVPEDEDGDDDEEYGMAAGEGLADFTSLDRKKMMWSIDVEQ